MGLERIRAARPGPYHRPVEPGVRHQHRALRRRRDLRQLRRFGCSVRRSPWFAGVAAAVVTALCTPALIVASPAAAAGAAAAGDETTAYQIDSGHSGGL